MIETKFKKTDIGEIPEAWDITSIGDIFDFKNGLNKEKQFFGEGTPIINYMDVYRHRGLGKNNICGKVRLSKNEISRYQVKAGDVFFTRTSETPDEVGITSVLKEDIPNCCFSGFVLRGRPRNNSLQVEYCQYCFSTKSIRTTIINSCTYTTRALTNGKVLSKIAIPIPPKPEQARIATTLSTIDNLISELGKLIEKKRAIKQGAMQQLLMGKKRLKGFGSMWENMTLGKICTFMGGYTPSKDQLSRVHGFPYFVVSDMNNPKNKTYLEYSECFVKLPQKIYPAGSIVFPKNGGALHTNKKRILAKDSVVDMNTEAVMPDTSKALIKFMFYYIQTMDLGVFDYGGSLPSMDINRMKSSSFQLPSIPEQQAIVSVLDNMDDEIANLEAKRDKYIAIKQGMMQQLLTGKIRLI